MNPLSQLETIGLAALALQDAITHRSAARKARSKAFRVAGIDPGASAEEIDSAELSEFSDRYKNARRAVKSARSSLRRLTVRYRKAEARKTKREAQGRLKQIELFLEVAA